VHALAEQLLKIIRKQQFIRAGDRVAAAVSGGADSVALLCLLLELQSELGIVLSVAHVNHKLRGDESNEDEHFVADLAQRHKLELHRIEAPIKNRNRSNTSKQSGIEAAARELRYSFFRKLAREPRVNKIATAHTLDDQAETLLLRIFRGTGIRGLAGIHPRIVFEAQGRVSGQVVRPLLSLRRTAIREFLRERGQAWREDSSNLDTSLLRNRVRHRLLPMIAEEFGDAAIEHMSELAEIARAEEEHWAGHSEIGSLTGYTADKTPQAPPLRTKSLLALPLATQRRLLRQWLEAPKSNDRDLDISFRLIEETLELVGATPGKKLELPGGWNVLRGRDELLLQSDSESSPAADPNASQSANYEYVIAIPGLINIPELDARIEACIVEIQGVPDDERNQLLNPELIPEKLLLRNWRAGDRYWPAHTAEPKKVKELLNDRHATGTEKKRWPVAIANGCGLIWMRGFAVPAAFKPPPEASKAIWIRELRP
jgi:tRNA(Ile)-lysidine synthase